MSTEQLALFACRFERIQTAVLLAALTTAFALGLFWNVLWRMGQGLGMNAAVIEPKRVS